MLLHLTPAARGAGPVVGIDVTPQMRLLVGGGVGLNHGRSGTIRLLTEYEWF